MYIWKITNFLCNWFTSDRRPDMEARFLPFSLACSSNLRLKIDLILVITVIFYNNNSNNNSNNNDDDGGDGGGNDDDNHDAVDDDHDDD